MKAYDLKSEGETLLLADIGNSMAKFAFRDGKKFKDFSCIPTEKLELSLFKKYPRAAVSCVVPKLKSKLARKKNILLIDASLYTGVDFGLINRKTIGSDRVAAAAAAAKIAKGNAIIIDCGTAISINALSSEKRFLGGAIIPGFELLSNSLNSGTSALPKIETTELKLNYFAGRDTVSAIRSGIYNLVIGGLKYIVDGIAKECEFRKYEVFITGGNGQKLLGKIPKSVYVNRLTIYGIFEIWKRQNES